MIKLRIEFWWLLERMAQRLWETWSRDRASYWMDPVTAFTYGKRKDAEFDSYKRRGVQ